MLHHPFNRFNNYGKKMTDLEWHDLYLIGVDFIDDDHKRLLSIMQHVRDSILQEDFKRCSTLLEELLVEANEHFTREEEFLTEANYPEVIEHHEYHQGLIEQASTVKSICDGIEEKHDLKECFDAMVQFLIDDILGGDIKFKSFLEDRGYI